MNDDRNPPRKIDVGREPQGVEHASRRPILSGPSWPADRVRRGLGVVCIALAIWLWVRSSSTFSLSAYGVERDLAGFLLLLGLAFMLPMRWS